MSIFKFLTFTMLITLSTQELFAAALDQTELKTHLRWNINAKKEQINITKKGSTVKIKTLDPEFFEELSSEILKVTKKDKYHADIKLLKAQTSGEPYTVQIDLRDDSIELFTFYKEDQAQYILDYWINEDIVETKKASLAAKPKITKLKPEPVKVKKVEAPKKPKAVDALTQNKTDRFKIINAKNIMKANSKEEYRDFRYGASFVWDYTAFTPGLDQDLDLNVKGPDFLYPLTNRENIEDKKEAHMQLSINFFNKAQWGLMTRSIKLYEEKYQKDINHSLNEYMKAVSMIKNTIKSKIDPAYIQKLNEEGDPLPTNDYSKKGIQAAARNILSNIIAEADNYEMNQAILRYLIQFSRNEKDHINSLEYAKKLYVKASEAFDDDMIIYSSKVILNSLANLKQLNKIEEFLQNKAVIRVLSKQEGLAYRGFIHLQNDDTKQIISEFIAAKKSLASPVHPAILFNTAEAYFREAKYSEAIKLFDEFLAEYSFYPKGSEARLRIALAYDLSGAKIAEVLRLYKDAINKSSDLAVRFEAKLRYVGLRAIRKVDLKAEDKETIVFINATKSEKKQIDDKHRKLLWLVRMRAMINSGEFDEALAYLTTLPLDSIKLIEKRVFEADGAEIVLGIIQKAYLNSDYSRAVKVWELYKEKYEQKVAGNPYMSFIVSDSFLKLGLIKSHERSIQYLMSLKNNRVRAFPRWVTPHKIISIEDYIVELKINKMIADNKYRDLASFLDSNKKNPNINYKFYNGLVSFKLKKYNDSVVQFENLLISPNTNNKLTPEQNLTMFEAYLESLYQTADGQKFRKNASALINDLRLGMSASVKPLLERAEYLYIESLAGDAKPNYSLLAQKTNEFMLENKNSNFKPRVSYLRGVSLVNNNSKEEGREILNSLLNDKDVPEYIKGLARSELSTLIIEEKKI